MLKDNSFSYTFAFIWKLCKTEQPMWIPSYYLIQAIGLLCFLKGQILELLLRQLIKGFTCKCTENRLSKNKCYHFIKHFLSREVVSLRTELKSALLYSQ